MLKKILLLPLLLLLFSLLSAQDIKYFFKILPSFYTEDLNGPTKDSLLQGKNFGDFSILFANKRLAKLLRSLAPISLSGFMASDILAMIVLISSICVFVKLVIELL